MPLIDINYLLSNPGNSRHSSLTSMFPYASYWNPKHNIVVSNSTDNSNNAVHRLFTSSSNNYSSYIIV